MTKASRTLVVCLLLSGCTVSNPYEGGTFESLSTTVGEGMTETGTSASTGDGDGDPATTSGDGDGDPATTSGDGDGDGDLTGDGDGDGDLTTTGDGDGEPVCERRRWRYDFEDDSWTSVPLDSVWAGNNAPPCDVEIWATSYIELNDQLLVLTADGLFYRRQGNSWVAPQAIADVFPEIDNSPIDSAWYVPPAGDGLASVVLNSQPLAYFYIVEDDGTVIFDETFALENDEPPGPPQGEFVRTWSFSFGDPELVGDLDWFGLWQRHTDGRVYEADADFNWESWDEDESPLFDGGGPDPAKIEDGWATYSPHYAYLIAP